MTQSILIRIAPAERAAWQTRLCGMTVLDRALAAARREGAQAVMDDGPAATGAGLILDRPYVIDRAMLRRMLVARSPDIHPPAVVLVASDPASRYAAKRALLDGTRKPADGIVAILVARPLSRWISYRLSETMVTPNQVTYLAVVLGLGAGVLAAMGGYGANVLAALCLFAGVVADCVDGELAKLRYQHSCFGEWIDSLSDDIATMAYLLGLAWAFAGALRVIGLAAAGLFLLSSLYTYYVLAKYVGVIDTARFPYFFAAADRAAAPPQGFFGKAVGYAFRRDFFIALFVVLALLGVPFVSLLILSLGVSVTVVAVLLTAILKPPGGAR